MKKLNLTKGLISLTLLTCSLFISCEKEPEIVKETEKDQTEEQNLNQERAGYSEMELEILKLVNQHRTSMGLEELTMAKGLYDLAAKHSKYMVDRNQLSHDNFNERAEIILYELGGSAVGENVAMGYRTANSVVNGWLNSQGHRENIEGSRFTKTGISAVRNSQGIYYYTQVFSN